MSGDVARTLLRRRERRQRRRKEKKDRFRGKQLTHDYECWEKDKKEGNENSQTHTPASARNVNVLNILDRKKRNTHTLAPDRRFHGLSVTDHRFGDEFLEAVRDAYRIHDPAHHSPPSTHFSPVLVLVVLLSLSYCTISRRSGFWFPLDPGG